ncbi:glutamate ABC transporter substrate-binding protein [Streptomyces sp. ISL-11]|uniref:glutamate ABC transporter substrate-binding protein n=1 Tax=Streptomyces sp. ISL-11 TaxID=2819174 RepID=UPI001BE5BB85|nr:glutamate ABC transporter substrate-binding protein [Streptomyces sp. ISL-11]MBT2385388.1 glutamate ABC transporter substrate-binding protein [Streptomyces sp. ISL-11]
MRTPEAREGTREVRATAGAPRRPKGLSRPVSVVVAAAVCAIAVTAAVAAPDRAGRTDRAPAAGAVAGAKSADAVTADAAVAAKCADPEASLRPSGVDGPAVQRIKNRGRLIAGVDQDSYRWGYRDPATGELSGFDIDLVRAIAKDILGDADKVTFLTIPTSQRIPALEKGKVDIIARTMSITCDRIRQVAFSTAYFEAGLQLLAPKGSSIKAFDDTLKGKKVCAAKGATAETVLKDEPHGASLLAVPNQLDCLVRVQLGQADAVLTDNALAAGQVAQDRSLELVGQRFTDAPYGVAMNLKDEDLVRRVNKVLEDYRGGGDGSPWMRAYRNWLALGLKGITAPPAPKYRD